MQDTRFVETKDARILRNRIKAAEHAYSEALRNIYQIKSGAARFDAESNGSRTGHPLHPLYMDLLAAIEAWRMYSWREVHRREASQEAA
jgi:sRNA-binding protein